MQQPPLALTSPDLAPEIVRKLQALSELDLTEFVLVPLFSALGYFDVQYHGGPYEGGKDLICKATDRFGELEVTVVQVKLFQASAAAKSKQRFGEIVDQLQQALEKPVPLTDGSEALPAAALFVTPFPLDVRALQTRFEAYSALRPRRVRILDGVELARLIQSKAPTLLTALLGAAPLIRVLTSQSLDNAALISALRINDEKAVAAFYCDLEFGIGRINSAFFFGRTHQPTEAILRTEAADWHAVRSVLTSVEHLLSISIVTPEYEAVEAQFQAAHVLYMAAQQDLAEANRSAQPLLDELALFETELLRCARTNDTKGDAAAANWQAVDALLEALSKLRLADPPEGHSKAVWRRRERAVWDRYQAIADLLPSYGAGALKLIVEKYIATATSLAPLNRRRRAVSAASSPVYNCRLNGVALALALECRHRWLNDCLSRFDQSEPTVSELREFLLSARDLFSRTDALWRLPDVATAAGFGLDQQFAVDAHKKRFPVSLRHVFATGVNLLLLGEAGAGKTTSLQIYAREKLRESTDSSPILYVPLARLAASSPRSTSFHAPRGETSDVPLLIARVAEYFNRQGIAVSADQLRALLRVGTPVLLFDGIDEAVGAEAWLPDAIRLLSTELPHAQIVASSRTSGVQASCLQFLEMTLLPFTAQQRAFFIRGWLGPQMAKVAEQLLDHLGTHPTLADVVTNPLLATILCVLAENGVRLPDTEVQLYEERLHLLLGVYDTHKGVHRIRSRHSDLWRIARKVAFALHRRNLRAAPVESLERWAKAAGPDPESKARNVAAVHELIEPCNVLVPMTDGGQFGFGHLRFQEHLVAHELRENRGLSLKSFIGDYWWEGPMILLAQMTDSIEDLIRELAIDGLTAAARSTLLAMLAVRPRDERVALEPIVEANADLDEFVFGTFSRGRYVRAADGA